MSYEELIDVFKESPVGINLLEESANLLSVFMLDGGVVGWSKEKMSTGRSLCVVMDQSGGDSSARERRNLKTE